MKKLILPALCLSFAFTSLKAVSAPVSVNVVVAVDEDGRKAIKAEELPEGITKTLAGDAYKGWNVKEAAVVTQTASDNKTSEHYEVTLASEKETKVIKFQKDGTVLN